MNNQRVRALGVAGVISAMLSAATLGQTDVRFQGITPGVNGDNFAQAIELRIAAGHNLWGGKTELAFYDAAGTQFFVFPFTSNAPQNMGTADACGLTSVLVATSQFVTMSGLSADFVLPRAQGNVLSLLHSEAGAVCFRGNGTAGAPTVNICLAYGHPQTCALSGLCCRANTDCTGEGDFCQLAPDIERGRIPFTAMMNGVQDGFTGNASQGTSGCPAPGISLTEVQALQQATPKAPGCCVGEACHLNSDFSVVTNPVWKNAAGVTRTIPLRDRAVRAASVFNTVSYNGNLRNCGTCHLPEDGFGLRPNSIGRIFNQDPLNPLFAAENIPGLSGLLENPCLMRSGNRRALILENTLGEPPVFRASMHLLNIKHTGPFGWSPCFGGKDNLIDFCQTAVRQHFARVLPRNRDPNVPQLLSNRNGTLDELQLLEEFQFTLKTDVRDGLGDLRGKSDGGCVGGIDDGKSCGPCVGEPPVCPPEQCPGGACVMGTPEENRDSNLTRLINKHLSFCPGASPFMVNAGRQRFADAGCMTCHLDPFLGRDQTFATGVVNNPVNLNTGCPSGCTGTSCAALTSEDQVCRSCDAETGCPGCTGEGCSAEGDGHVLFDIRPLIDVARIKRGLGTSGTPGTFFHDSSAGTLRQAIEFYNSPASRAPVLPNSPAEVREIEAFLTALVEPDDVLFCPTPVVCSDISRLRMRCASDGNVEALTILRNTGVAHDLQSVKIEVNGVPQDVPIVGRFASHMDCCPVGHFEMRLLEPAGCNVAPATIDCLFDPTGACCKPDGECGVGHRSVCINNGFTFEGEGTTCSTVQCVQPPPGACCAPNGSCSIATQFTCSGTFQGADTTCETTACEQPPPGACCFLDGHCEILNSFTCGGTFLGGATTCDPQPCPDPQGACCLPNGSCTTETEAGCASAGGLYNGHGSLCSPNNCFQPFGSCCHIDGTCTENTQLGCEGSLGVFQGNATACSTTNCPAPAGACCLSNGTCTAAPEAVCEGVGGEYRGDGRVCSAISCARPICSEVRRIRIGCVKNGTVQALTILDNLLHEGQTVTIRVNGQIYTPTVSNRQALELICCPTGLITMELLDPPGCVAPITFTCTP